MLVVGPLLGLIGMNVGVEKPGFSDPAALSASIDEALASAAAGVVAFAIDAVLLVICGVILVRSQREPPPLPARAPQDSGN